MIAAQESQTKFFLLSFLEKQKLGNFLFCGIGMVALLSLLSYHPEDTHIIEKGLQGYTVLENWLSFLGARIAFTLLLWFGLAAYLGGVAIIISVLLRIGPFSLKPMDGLYVAGTFIFMIGCSMIIGHFPNVYSPFVETLNIAGIPGGVIGERLCSPWSIRNTGGCLSYVFHPTISIIVSIFVGSFGLATFWYYDWRDVAMYFWSKPESKPTLTPDSIDKNDQGIITEKKEKAEKKPDPKAKEQLPADKKKSKKAVQEDVFGTTNTGVPEQVIPRLLVPHSQKASSDTPSWERKSSFPLALLNEPCLPEEVPSEHIDYFQEFLQTTLDGFGIDATVLRATSNFRAIRFEIDVAAGVYIERIASLKNTLAMKLQINNLRILTPIPGKNLVGIEIPHSFSHSIPLAYLFLQASTKKTAIFPWSPGKTISGESLEIDLTKTPHVLLGGNAQVNLISCMHAMIIESLYYHLPETLKIVIVDPVEELSVYSQLPHLATPILTDAKKAVTLLQNVLCHIKWRHQIFREAKVRNLHDFHSQKQHLSAKEKEHDLPRVLLMITEVSNLFTENRKKVQSLLSQITKEGGKVGVHVVAGTSRDSIHMLHDIKSFFPVRIAFQTSSILHSRLLLDLQGAELLMEKDDMIIKTPSLHERIQGYTVTDDEIEAVTSFMCNKYSSQHYMKDLLLK